MEKRKGLEYFVDYLSYNDFKVFFLVTGGAIAPTVDYLGKKEEIKYYCFQHEQSAAMAAEASQAMPGAAKIPGTIYKKVMAGGAGIVTGSALGRAGGTAVYDFINDLIRSTGGLGQPSNEADPGTVSPYVTLHSKTESDIDVDTDYDTDIDESREIVRSKTWIGYFGWD